MKQLLWKDYRLNRTVLILGATVLVMVYVLGVVAEIASTWPGMPSANGWGEMLVAYGTVAMYLTACVTALLGGNAIACERADRTAHFLAYLPPTKGQIIASKLLVAACATAVMWGWILLSVYVIAPRLSQEPVDFLGTVTAPSLATLCVLTFGVGWFGSACLETAIVPVLIAFAAPVGVGLGLLAIGVVFGIPRFEVAEWSPAVCFWVGIAAFVAGTWSYLRRVEP